MSFLYPLQHTWERPYVGAGLMLYDAMAQLGAHAGKHSMGVPRHKHVFRRQLARMAPDLRTDELAGAIRYYDCQVDDARLVVNIARTAAAYGAHIASRAITRYVVSLPPAIITRPGRGAATVCSREIFDVGSVAPLTSGRSPA